jgi:hypothetical protein
MDILTPALTFLYKLYVLYRYDYMHLYSTDATPHVSRDRLTMVVKERVTLGQYVPKARRS